MIGIMKTRLQSNDKFQLCFMLFYNFGQIIFDYQLHRL